MNMNNFHIKDSTIEENLRKANDLNLHPMTHAIKYSVDSISSHSLFESFQISSNSNSSSSSVDVQKSQ